MNMLISKSKIFRRQFFSKVCSSYILPSGHSPVMTLSSQNQKTTSQSCFCAVNLQEKTYAEVCSNFIETTLQHGCFPEGLLHIFRALFNRSTSEGLLLQNRFKPGLKLRGHQQHFSRACNVICCITSARKKRKWPHVVSIRILLLAT